MNYPVVSIAGAIFSPDRTQILLIKRRDVPVWVLPGGGIEKNESPENAVIREIFEETGFTVKIKRLVGLYIPINRLAKVTHLYECHILHGEAILSSETSGIQFFSLSQLPKEIPPPFREWIEDAQNIQPPVTKKLGSVNYTSLLFYFFSHPILVIRFLLSRMGIHVNTNNRNECK